MWPTEAVASGNTLLAEGSSLPIYLPPLPILLLPLFGFEKEVGDREEEEVWMGWKC